MNAGKIVIDTTLETKTFEKQIDEVQDKIFLIEQKLSKSKELGLKETEVAKLNVELEKARNKLGDLVDKQNKLNESSSKVDFSKWTKQLTKVGLAMFGIRSAMGILRKASSTYLSQNEEVARKIESLWIALGNAIGPIIDLIADGILKLVGYLNVFVGVLTGGKLDLTKGMNKNTSSINGTTKAMKELNKQLASFDEMNVLQKEASYGGGGVSSGVSSFTMPELDPKIVAFLEKLAKALKDNWDWIWKVGVALGVVFGAAKIAIALKNIASLLGSAGAGEGLLGLSSILTTLATIGVITLGVSLIYTAMTGRDLVNDLAEIKKGYDYLKESQQAYEEATKSENSTLRKLIDTHKELERQGKVTDNQTKNYIDTLLNSTNTNMKHNDELKKQLTLIGELTGSNKTIKESMTNLNGEINLATKALLEEYKQGNLNKDQKKQLIDLLEKQIRTLQTQNDNLDKSSSKYKENYNKIKDLKGSLEDITGKKYNIEVEIPAPKTSPFKQAINSMLNGVESAFKGMGFTVKLPKLAKGGIVNNPGRGTYIGGAIAGEAGAEWVQPLTDQQSLNMIAEAIGNRINISLTNITKLDNRQIAREQKIINAQSDFASNR